MGYQSNIRIYKSSISGYQSNKVPATGEVQIKWVISQISESISQIFLAISQIKSPVLEKCK